MKRLLSLSTVLLSFALVGCASKQKGGSGTLSPSLSMSKGSSKTQDYAGRGNDGGEFDGYDLHNSYNGGKVDRVFFEFDNSDLSKNSLLALKRYLDSLSDNELRNSTIVLEGHTDERGTSEYNMSLGYRRANATKESLRQLGCDMPVKVKSYGKFKPAVDEHHPRAFAMNRRVELKTEGS